MIKIKATEGAAAMAKEASFFYYCEVLMITFLNSYSCDLNAHLSVEAMLLTTRLSHEFHKEIGGQYISKRQNHCIYDYLSTVIFIHIKITTWMKQHKRLHTL